MQKVVKVNISTFTVSRRMCPANTAQSIEDSEREVGVRSGQVRELTLGDDALLYIALENYMGLYLKNLLDSKHYILLWG